MKNLTLPNYEDVAAAAERIKDFSVHDKNR